MKLNGATFLRRLLKETSGQTMYIAAAALSSDHRTFRDGH